MAGSCPRPRGADAAEGEEAVSTLTDAERRDAYALLIVMAACFGGTWVAGTWAVEEIAPFSAAVIRFGVGAAILYAWIRATGRSLSPVRRADLPLVGGLGLTGVAAYNWFFLTGLTHAPATDGSILVPGSIPILTALLATVLLRERLGSWALVGMGIAVAGLVLVIGPGGGASGTRLAGDLLFFGGAVMWSGYNILVRLATRRFNAVSATLYAMLAGAGILLVGAVVEGWAGVGDASPRAWLSIGYLALFGSVIAFVALQVGVARLGATRASAFTLLVPIFGVVLSVVLLGEELSPASLVGGVIVLLGLWLVQRPEVRASRAA